jgi:hypothetical protein
MNILREVHPSIELVDKKGEEAVNDDDLLHFGFHSRRVKGSITQEFLERVLKESSSN